MSRKQTLREPGLQTLGAEERGGSEADRRSVAPAVSGQISDMSPPEVGGLLRPLRRFWSVTAIVLLLSLAGASYSVSALSDTYTGRASLIVSSNNRSPDQDAVLVQGYVDYFNDIAYQQQLARSVGLDGVVTLTARAAAASPILLVEATTDSRDKAQSAAAAVAGAFQTDLNRVRDQQQRRQVRKLEDRLEQVGRAGGPDAATSVAALQDQIAEVEADRTNRLQELQFEGGVSMNSPNPLTNVAFAGLGGLILGVLAAIALDRIFRPGPQPRG
ncbi:hypothetical protein [Nocardioides aurantiacus]|uniref:hypothetical protein n=1 Tax=Nocardioides aurantiacus TaxID=86796 RepID=UPI00403F37E8